MPSDPRDYTLDLTTAAPLTPTTPAPRPFLSITFACCNTYARIYRSPDASHYAGHCPRCARPVRFAVGNNGTPHRAFIVR